MNQHQAVIDDIVEHWHERLDAGTMSEQLLSAGIAIGRAEGRTLDVGATANGMRVVSDASWSAPVVMPDHGPRG